MTEHFSPTAPRPAVPRLGYGAANLGNLMRAFSDAEAWAILEAAWVGGIRHFDTSPHYGLGLSERRLGAFLATKPRDEFTVSTKVGRLLEPDPTGAGFTDVANLFHVPADLRRVWDFTADGLRRSLADSLGRLGLDRVDVLYLHDPERWDLARALETGLPALATLREERLVSRVGVASMDSRALLSAARSGIADLVMAAGRCTLLDHVGLAELAAACRATGTSIVAAEVFSSGLAAEPVPPDDAVFDYEPAPVAMLDRARRIAAIAGEHGVDLPTLALHFPLRSQLVESVVVGAAAPEHVAQNIARLAAAVPSAVWDALAAEGLIGEELVG